MKILSFKKVRVIFFKKKTSCGGRNKQINQHLKIVAGCGSDMNSSTRNYLDVDFSFFISPSINFYQA